MSAERMVLVVGQIFQGFHLKNRRTLAVLMTALVASGKVGIASLGRAIKSRASFKHSIKRVDRFLANDNVVVSDWCKALTDTVIGPRQAIKIAIDWTKIGPWPVLVASVVIKRRGIPIYWATCDWRRLKRSQNAFEESFLVMLRDMIPYDLDAILLFDRGFRRVSLVRHLKMLGFHFVIRSCADTHIMTLSNEKIALCKLHLPCGVVKDLGHVLATIDKPEDVRLVAVFEHGQKEPWLLFSDLDLPAIEIIRLYGRHFTIGQKGLDRGFKANTSKQKTHSLFQLGWKDFNLLCWLPDSWFARFYRLDFNLNISDSPDFARKVAIAF